MVIHCDHETGPNLLEQIRIGICKHTAPKRLRGNHLRKSAHSAQDFAGETMINMKRVEICRVLSEGVSVCGECIE